MKNIEIERKFKLINNDWKNLVKEVKKIEQVYLNEKNPAIRLRKVDGVFIMTIKIRNTDNSNIELETKVEESFAIPLFEKYKENVIIKTRNIIKSTKYKEIAVDVFEGRHNGVAVCEIEFNNFTEANDKINFSFTGEEVTNDIKYSNSYLACN